MTAIMEPATKFVAVTPSDVTVIYATRLYIGGAGAVALVPLGGGAAVTFAAVPAGTILDVSCSQVMATNTTATNIVALT